MPNAPEVNSVWDELLWRGLVCVSTDQGALKELLDGPPIRFYCGFDPTAPSLHVGNLAQILIMRRLQLAGHRPIALVGGSTGLIGDPRPGGERQLHSHEQVQEWVRALQQQLSRFLDFKGAAAAVLVNNLDWTKSLTTLDFLRELGKHFRVNAMLKKDAVAARLSSTEGISYTEFSYQILQSLDFRQLYLDYKCVLQIGGSDQWGNITSGVDLIRKTEGAGVHAFGSPLLTASDGSKFGKTEGNAIWLDADLTSPWSFYQFFLNSDDADIPRLLRVFTFFTRSEIEDLNRSVRENASARLAHRHLAYSVTRLVHGADVADQVLLACSVLFGDGGALGKTQTGLPRIDSDTLNDSSGVTTIKAQDNTYTPYSPEGVRFAGTFPVDPRFLRSILFELPNATVSAHDLITHILQKVGLCRSLSEARRLISQGGIYVNNIKVTCPDALLDSFLDNSMPIRAAILRKGKKHLAAVFY
ncbi:tyrosine--tRNA ligase [Tropheryma whipplei]|uniref:tyrosine--tRNA ligase n=1 Tax=Tropheryma whipplei TaxID=2039 RepID=UPI0004B6D87F|nr:tyrosine--tRNA ligase [Tropheryma whipplei]